MSKNGKIPGLNGDETEGNRRGSKNLNKKPPHHLAVMRGSSGATGATLLLAVRHKRRYRRRAGVIDLILHIQPQVVVEPGHGLTDSRIGHIPGILRRLVLSFVSGHGSGKVSSDRLLGGGIRI